MRVAILQNPNAGRGKGAAVAARFHEEASRSGHEVRALDVTKGHSGNGSHDPLGEMVEWSEAVVIVGGDGTLHHSLSTLMEHRRPVYHAAMGTENLFARGFGHGRSHERFLRAIGTGSVRRIDVATLSLGGSAPSPMPFAIMASLGPDASVVHRLSALRSGPISHLSYVKPTLAELTSPRIPTLTIRVDGKELVRERRGMVVIANMRQYAVGLNPASRADPSDGLLDVVFLPGRSIVAVVMSLSTRRLGVGAVGRAARGRHVEVELGTADHCLPQADGEAVKMVTTQETISVATNTPRVLTAQVVPMGLDVFVI